MSQSYRTIQYNFSGGLVSPLQEGAVSSALYQAGLSIAENVLYGPGYGIMKRHGTQYQAPAYSSASAVYPFLYGGVCHGVEFKDRQARLITFSEDGGEATRGTWITTPYSSSDVRALSVVSNADSLYIVHPSYPPQVITISGGDLASCTAVQFVAAIEPASPVAGDYRTTAVTFSAAGDYPSRQLFYGGRWFLMSTINNPQMIWFSRAYDSENQQYRYNDFTMSKQVYVDDGTGSLSWEDLTLADLGGIYLNSDMHGSTIRWAIAHQNLLIATGRAIYSDKGNSTVTATTDYAFTLTPSLSYGSAGREALALGSYVFFAGSDNRSVRCIAYSEEYNSYAGTDISAAVSQYLSGGIRKMCITDGQMPLLWVLSNDGHLLCCYFQSGQIIAWSRITFDGDDTPQWIETVQGGDSGYCALMIVMERSGSAFIENLEIVSPSALWTYPSVDCWKKKDTAGETVSSPVQTRDCVVSISYRDGDSGGLRMLAQHLDAGDTRTVGSEGGEVDYVGFAYSMVAGTLRTELPANGTSQGARRAISSVTLRLFNSIGGSIALRPEIDDSMYPYLKADELITSSKAILYRVYGSTKYGEAYQLFTGDKATQFSSAVLDDDRIVIVASDPFPFCICAIIVKHSVTEA